MKIILDRVSSSFFLNYSALVRVYFLELHSMSGDWNSAVFRQNELACGKVLPSEVGVWVETKSEGQG